jgi:uncharacterized protein (TIGR02444 family)
MTQAETLDLDNPLWSFALDFYGRPGVAEACLAIQDALDADIVELVVILYAWSRLGISLSEAEGAVLRAEMQAWRETSVLPLRQIRHALKPPRSDMPHATKEALRDQVKRAELLAEQMQIAWSNDWLEGLKRTNRSLEHNPVPTWFVTATTGDPKSKIRTEAFSVVVQTVTDMRLRS